MAGKPRGLKTAGSRLWETVNAEFDMDAEPAKIEILSQACRVSDTIAQLERAAVREPLIVLGSARQQTINPLISETRFQRGLLAQLLGRLGLPDTDEEAALKAAKLSATRRTAAKSARLKVVP